MGTSSTPLPLSEVRDGDYGKDYEDLNWYFTEASAAQSGLKSSQSSFEHKMFAGIGQPPARHELDGRLVSHISRARDVEKRLGRIGVSHRRWLFVYFTSIAPRLVSSPPKEAKRIKNKYERFFTEAMQAYRGGP